MGIAPSRPRRGRSRRSRARRRRRRAKELIRRSQRRALRRLRRARGSRRAWRRRRWWEQHPLELAALEARLPPEYEGFIRRVVGRALVYNGEVHVPDVGRRTLVLVFRGRPATRAPIVMASGPRRSRHRYHWARPTSLCIWYPWDPPPRRWTLREGLVGLIDRARVHLLLEAWWRVEGRWDAPEVHREPRGDEQPRRTRLRPKAIGHPCWCGGGLYRGCHSAIPEADELAELGLPPRDGRASEPGAAHQTLILAGSPSN